MTAYQFWYIPLPGDKTQYIWIIANTPEEALDIFRWNGYHDFYDYSDGPNDILPESEWIDHHESGQIYGGDAVL